MKRMDDAERIEIKLLAEKVVKLVGGQKVCASVSTRITRNGTFGDYSNIADVANYFMPVDVAIELDRYLIAKGMRPHFAQDYAERIDHLLIPLPPGDGIVSPIAEQAARSAEEMGQLMAGIYRALSDSVITEAEARPLLKLIRELMLHLASLAEQLMAQAKCNAGGPGKGQKHEAVE